MAHRVWGPKRKLLAVFWTMALERQPHSAEPASLTGMRIAPAGSKDDLRAVADLKAVAFGDTGWQYPDWTHFEGFDQDGVFLACEGDKAVSFVVSYVRPTSRDQGYISVVGTAPPYRRRGIATALIHHALDRFWRLGCQRVSIDVATDNLPAVRVYQSVGFQKVSEFLADENCETGLGMCYQCRAFAPEPREKNCPIANDVIAVCERRDVVLRVDECSRFQARKTCESPDENGDQ